MYSACHVCKCGRFTHEWHSANAAPGKLFHSSFGSSNFQNEAKKPHLSRSSRNFWGFMTFKKKIIFPFKSTNQWSRIFRRTFNKNWRLTFCSWLPCSCLTKISTGKDCWKENSNRVGWDWSKFFCKVSKMLSMCHCMKQFFVWKRPYRTASYFTAANFNCSEIFVRFLFSAEYWKPILMTPTKWTIIFMKSLFYSALTCQSNQESKWHAWA